MSIVRRGMEYGLLRTYMGYGMIPRTPNWSIYHAMGYKGLWYQRSESARHCMQWQCHWQCQWHQCTIIVREYSSNSKRVAWIEKMALLSHILLLVLSIQLNLRFQLLNCGMCDWAYSYSGLIGVWIFQSKHVCFSVCTRRESRTPKTFAKFGGGSGLWSVRRLGVLILIYRNNYITLLYHFVTVSKQNLFLSNKMTLLHPEVLAPKVLKFLLC